MFTTRIKVIPSLAEMSHSVYEFPEGIFTGLRFTTQRIIQSLSQWFLSRRATHPVVREDPNTDRAKAIALAQFVVQKKNLGISLVPSQALLLSREFLQSVYHEEMMRHHN